eukprot:gene23517-9040_t
MIGAVDLWPQLISYLYVASSRYDSGAGAHIDLLSVARVGGDSCEAGRGRVKGAREYQALGECQALCGRRIPGARRKALGEYQALGGAQVAASPQQRPWCRMTSREVSDERAAAAADASTSDAQESNPGNLDHASDPETKKRKIDTSDPSPDAAALEAPPELQLDVKLEDPVWSEQPSASEPAAHASSPPAPEATSVGALKSEVLPTMEPPFPFTSGAYTQREEVLQQQEAEGEIVFHYVQNDGAPHNMMYLTGLKNIFSKQLPNMPKEYICRLVFDRRHRSSALVKKNGTVIGGITYRSFPIQGFGEIAFCAITSNEQARTSMGVKGYGTRLMNYTKEFARTRDQLTHFLTYADNNAVGYFTKQGFTKEIYLDHCRWYGFIKDYDGGTLMECALHPKICYTEFPELIKKQRTALEARIRSISNSHIVHPGLGHHFTTEVDVPATALLSIMDIPGVKEAGWEPDIPKFQLLFKEGVEDVNPSSLERFMSLIIDELSRMEEAWPFMAPVNPAEVPDYPEVIKYPMDLSLIRRRLESQSFYINLDIFAADVRCMVDNCRLYNAADTIFYKMANRLESAFKQYINTHLVFDTPKHNPSEAA